MTEQQTEQVAALPGSAQPLGATYQSGSINFALYAPRAERVELCILTPGGEARLDLPERTGDVWHGCLPPEHPLNTGVGLRYGYRVHGPHDPEQGEHFDPGVRLLDPYARQLSGPEEPVHNAEGFVATLQAPWGIVTAQRPPVSDDTRPGVPWEQTIVYEAHVRGLTMTHPDVPEDLRGTYAGLATEPVIRYLKDLGVTTIELLPVHAHVDDPFLRNKDLSNYWGYSTLSFFAPEPRYSAAYRRGDPAGAAQEFRGMVERLHEAGLEVVLDVVYNHTAEGGKGGPLLSMRGLANSDYYWLNPSDLSEYMDFTGTGNSLRVSHPRTLQLVLDSLRYWVTEMGVDGFRFDLAPTLGRTETAHSGISFDRHSAFMASMTADPVLSRVKLIAEPWDIGLGGYQLGQFGTPWVEWNDQYRDTVRAFWKGDSGIVSDLGYRLTGSSDVFSGAFRRPRASVNFVAAHDGFCLRDVVSYNDKHNEANGEEGRDGHDHNLSWNMGVEGDTDDAEVLALRRRQVRNLLATLLISQGTPMLLAGDELGRTQRGNNNAYAQDNDINWLDWAAADRELAAFVGRLTELRHTHSALRRDGYFSGREVPEEGSPAAALPDIAWLRFDGAEMTDADWQNAQTQSLGLFLRAQESGEQHLLVLMNASHVDLPFQLPGFAPQEDGENAGAILPRWTLLVDTKDDAASGELDAGATTDLTARSLQILGASES